MKGNWPRVLVVTLLVFAVSLALLMPPSMGTAQKAYADSPATQDQPKSEPDTFVPADGPTSEARTQSSVPSVGPGAIRSGFESTDLNPNDDGSTGLVAIGFPINFFGTTYTDLYVNNNGNVTFDGPMGTYTPFNIVTAGTPIIAPFFADVDTRYAGQPTRYGTSTVDERPAFGATWRDVDYYDSDPSHTNRNHFQLVLTDRSDIAPGDFDIEFNYDQIQWEAGTASDSDANGLGGWSARSGYSNGAAAAFEIPGSGVNGAFLDGNGATGLALHSLNSSQTGRCVFQVRGGLPPAVLTTDTVNLNAGASIVSNVTVQNMPAAGLGSYSMTVNFDPAVVNVESVGDGDAPFGAPTTCVIDNTAGTVALAGSQTGFTPSGTIVLARLNLRGTGNGASALGVTNDTLMDATGGPTDHVVSTGVATVNTPAVTTGSGNVLVGSAIDIPLSVQGLVNQSLATYDVTISFAPALVNVSSVAGGQWPFDSPTTTIDNGSGTITLSQTVAGGFPTGNVTLASLRIQGLADGVSDLAIAVTTLSNSGSQAIIYATDPGAVTVTSTSTLDHIIIGPANPSLPVNGSETFTAEGYDQFGSLMSGLTFVWSCTDPTAGSIDPAAGAFTAGTTPGTYVDVIQATSGAVSGSTSVTVVAAGPGLRGDVNGDGVVDILDLMAVAAAFNSVPVSPNWNAAADLIADGTVNILDLALVGLCFGNQAIPT